MTHIPQPQEIYRHFKGNLYQIITVAEHSETGERLVIYQALYGDFKIYARELSMFMGRVDRKKYPNVAQSDRFVLFRQGMSGEDAQVGTGEKGAKFAAGMLCGEKGAARAETSGNTEAAKSAGTSGSADATKSAGTFLATETPIDTGAPKSAGTFLAAETPIDTGAPKSAGTFLAAETPNDADAPKEPEAKAVRSKDSGADESRQTDEGGLDPMLMDFLDAKTYEQKLNILAGLHHRITQDMITTMAVACDVEVGDGELENRYDQLKTCLLTLEKYECNRLR